MRDGCCVEVDGCEAVGISQGNCFKIGQSNLWLTHCIGTVTRL